MENLRLHYSKTLIHWHERFLANREKVVEMYDERFARMWEFYLQSAEMVFSTGPNFVFHMQLSRNRDAAPITRDYMVDAQRELEKLEKNTGFEFLGDNILIAARKLRQTDLTTLALYPAPR